MNFRSNLPVLGMYILACENCQSRTQRKQRPLLFVKEKKRLSEAITLESDGANLLLAGVGSGFLLGEGFEEMFPWLILNGFGQQNNVRSYTPQRQIQPTAPPTARPPTNQQKGITWRWIPHVRYLWQLPGSNMKWEQPNFPMAMPQPMPMPMAQPMPHPMPGLPPLPMVNPATNTVWDTKGSGNKV